MPSVERPGKPAGQARWLTAPEHQGYFRSPLHFACQLPGSQRPAFGGDLHERFQFLSHRNRRSAFLRPTRASIAVLPFASVAADGPGSSSDYLGDGLTEDIISALGRFRDLSVISRGGVFAYKGKSPTPAEVGRDLKVRYLVEGSVRRAPDHIRVVASLTDAAHGAVLWSEKYDVDPKDIFSVQDQITSRWRVGGQGNQLGARPIGC